MEAIKGNPRLREILGVWTVAQLGFLSLSCEVQWHILVGALCLPGNMHQSNAARGMLGVISRQLGFRAMPVQQPAT